MCHNLRQLKQLKILMSMQICTFHYPKKSLPSKWHSKPSNFFYSFRKNFGISIKPHTYFYHWIHAILKHFPMRYSNPSKYTLVVKKVKKLWIKSFSQNNQVSCIEEGLHPSRYTRKWHIGSLARLASTIESFWKATSNITGLEGNGFKVMGKKE